MEQAQPTAVASCPDRLQHWPRLLSEFIEARRHLPFAWGSNDCCLFACDAIAAITGIDPADGLRGKYRTALGAARLLKKKGGVLIIANDQCAARGWKPCGVVFASHGDVVASDKTQDNRPALGVCLGKISAFPGRDGIEFIPTLGCLNAWKIGKQ